MKVASSSLLLVVLFALSFIAVVSAQQFPAVYNITDPSIIAEGIEYDPVNNRLVIGSIGTGFIRTITTGGTLSVLSNDARLTMGTFGIDYYNGSLYVAVANFSALAPFNGTYYPGNVQSALAIISANTGVLSSFIDLTPFGNGSAMWANDVAYAPSGLVYLTDTLGRQLWVVDPIAGTVQTVRSSLFSTNAVPNGFGLNGVKPFSNYIITCSPDSGIIFKVQNQSVSIVNGLTIVGCDGIRTTVKTPQTLVFSTAGRIYEVGSNDSFATAYVLQSQNTTFGTVSTSALVPDGANTQVYSLNLRATSIPPVPAPIERTLTISGRASPSPSPAGGSSFVPSTGSGMALRSFFADVTRKLF